MKQKLFIYISLIALLSVVTSTYAQERIFLSSIAKTGSQIEGIPPLMKIVPSDGYASSFQNGENIEKCFDGNMNSLYHSSWTNTQFPVTLKFNFTNVGRIDYMIYHPRQEGENGIFKEIEVWCTLQGKPRTKLGEYNLEGKSTSSTINFPESLNNPASIEVIVKSGVGNFASCAEMEFYRINRETENLFDVFADPLMTKLKTGVTLTDINQIPNDFVREVASLIYNDLYDFDYRVAEFDAYWDLDELNRTFMIGNGYNKYENPTGIYFPKGKHIIIAENIAEGKKVDLLIPDYRYTGGGGSLTNQSFTLKNGINVIDLQGWDGLGYISYFSKTPDQENTIKVHFMKGYVHGYFDITKHDNADWNILIENASRYPVMDAVGRYSQLAYTVDAYKKYAYGKGVELVNGYDTVVGYQHRLCGFEKYNIRPKNRVLCRINYHYFMYRDGDGASYENSTMSYVSSPTGMFESNWGITHEIGHIHQMKFNNWHGMGEVSVNFPNIYITDRLLSPNDTDEKGDYNKAYNSIVVTGIPYLKYEGEGSIDHNFGRLIPFAQLYHYFVQKGYNDFYPDLYQSLRSTTENTNNWEISDYEINFIRKACDVAKLNLIPFFEKWGFIYYTDADGRSTFEVGDYGGKRTYSLSKSKVEELKAYIREKGYPEPDEDITLVKPNGARIR